MIYADNGVGTNPWFMALYCLASSLVKIHLLNSGCLLIILQLFVSGC